MTANTTAAWAYFMGELIEMEPGTENSGTYANKPGYHNTRANLIAQGLANDYSIRTAVDKSGRDDVCAAGDWTFHDAQSGNYSSIVKYMKRIESSFHAKDPRFAGWREVLGQSDTDAMAEGYDFDGWYTRTPDPSHIWHIHFSEHRNMTESVTNKNAMLSVLKGETLSDWLGGVVVGMVAANLDDVVKMLAIGAKMAGPLRESAGPPEEDDLYFHLVKSGNTLAGIKSDIAKTTESMVPKIVEGILAGINYELLANSIAAHINGELSISLTGSAKPVA